MDLQKVEADSKRIAEKLREMELLAERDKLHNKPPADSSARGPGDKVSDQNAVRYGWREDEDDRWTAPGRLFSSYRQNPYADEHPEQMNAIMKALFLADHDASQLEQYELENGPAMPAMRKPYSFMDPLKRGLAILFTVIVIMGGQATKAKAQALKVGDIVPDITITNMVNHPTGTAKLSDFKGKLLILDFWASWCAVCIPSLSQLDSLQQQFGEQIMVLPVSSQPTELIRAFVEKKGWKLPSVTGDNALERMFPHRSVPHQVWIRDGVVKSITAHFSATPANIRAMLDDRPVDILEKNDRMDFDAARPLLLNGNGGPVSRLNYQSLITGYMDGLGYTTLLAKGIIQVTNNSALFLYSKALEKQYPWLKYKNRARLELSETLSSRLAPPAGLKGEAEARWYIQNGYCYNLVMPPATPVKAMATMMHADLNRFFGAAMQVEGNIEKVKTRCLVLKRTGGKDLLKSSGETPAYSRADGKLVLRNKPFKVLTDALAFTYSRTPLPFIDESDYSGSVDMALAASLDDLPALRKELKRYGLSLEEEEREPEMLVLRQTQTPLN